MHLGINLGSNSQNSDGGGNLDEFAEEEARYAGTTRAPRCYCQAQGEQGVGEQASATTHRRRDRTVPSDEHAKQASRDYYRPDLENDCPEHD